MINDLTSLYIGAKETLYLMKNNYIFIQGMGFGETSILRLKGKRSRIFGLWNPRP